MSKQVDAWVGKYDPHHGQWKRQHRVIIEIPQTEEIERMFGSPPRPIIEIQRTEAILTRAPTFDAGLSMHAKAVGRNSAPRYAITLVGNRVRSTIGITEFTLTKVKATISPDGGKLIIPFPPITSRIPPRKMIRTSKYDPIDTPHGKRQHEDGISRKGEMVRGNLDAPRWTPEEIETLKFFAFEQNKGPAEIAHLMPGRSAPAITCKIRTLRDRMDIQPSPERIAPVGKMPTAQPTDVGQGVLSMPDGSTLDFQLTMAQAFEFVQWAAEKKVRINRE